MMDGCFRCCLRCSASCRWAMSGDFEVAIQEGSTNGEVGTAILGADMFKMTM